MRLKLDENLGVIVLQKFVQAGFEVATVAQQNMRGSSDKILIEACQKERRCLITLDMGFANPISYQPSKYSWIAVIRLPKQQLIKNIIRAVDILIDNLKKREIEGRLWIVHKDRIRQYSPESIINPNE